MTATDFYTSKQCQKTMKRYCMSCGNVFDADKITSEQVEFYGKTICEECWIDAPSSGFPAQVARKPE